MEGKSQTLSSGMCIGGFEGGISPQTYLLPPCHKGTTISFTESLTKFSCFYALQHKLNYPDPITLGSKPGSFAPPLRGPRSTYGTHVCMVILQNCTHQVAIATGQSLAS